MEEKSLDEISVDPSFYRIGRSSSPSFQRVLYPYLKGELITDTPMILEQLQIEKKNAKDLHLYQVRSFQQTNSFNCGYHSLYSSQILYEMITSADEIVLEYFGHLYSKKSFWSFFDKIGNSLLVECKRRKDENGGKEMFPWESKNVRDGILERTYMEFLLKEMSREEGAFFCIPDLCPIHLMEDPGLIPPEKIREISTKFESFFKSPKSCVVFLIGTLQHWFDIVANKYEDGKVEFIICCSSNMTYFGLTEEEMSEQVETRVDESLKRNVNEAPMRDYLLKRKHRAIEQTQKIVKMVAECCLGRTTFTQFCVDCGLRGILNEYYDCSRRRSSSFKVWGFLAEFPVKQMEDGIMEVLGSFGEECAPVSAHYGEFRDWLKDIMGEIGGCLVGEKSSEAILDGKKKSMLLRLKKLLMEMERKYFRK